MSGGRMRAIAGLILLVGGAVAACGSQPPAETALVAGHLLQKEGVFQAGALHMVTGAQLHTYGDSYFGSSDASYNKVVENVFSPFGDQVSVWQFSSAAYPNYAFDGDPPAIAATNHNWVFLCGPLLVIGDTSPKVDNARAALAKHYKNCTPVIKAPNTFS